MRSRPTMFRKAPRPGDGREGPVPGPNSAETPPAVETMDRLLRCAGWPRQAAPQQCLRAASPRHRPIAWSLPRQAPVDNRCARPPLPRRSHDHRHTGASPSRPCNARQLGSWAQKRPLPQTSQAGHTTRVCSPWRARAQVPLGHAWILPDVPLRAGPMPGRAWWRPGVRLGPSRAERPPSMTSAMTITTATRHRRRVPACGRTGGRSPARRPGYDVVGRGRRILGRGAFLGPSHHPAMRARDRPRRHGLGPAPRAGHQVRVVLIPRIGPDGARMHGAPVGGDP